MKKLIAILMTLVLTFSLAGCSNITENSGTASTPTQGTASTPPATSEPDEKYLVGVDIYSIEVEYFATFAHFMEVAAEDHGWDIVVQSGDSTDPSTQVDILENFITMGCDAIVINPVNIATVQNAMQEAHDAGIKIIAVNVSPEQASAADVYIYSDSYYEMGVDIADLAYECADGIIPEGTEVKVAALVNYLNENNGERCDGMIDGSKANWGEDSVVNATEVTESTAEYAMAAAESILQMHPDVNVWVCMNDSLARGVLEYYKSNNLDQSQVVIVGNDGDQANLEAIIAGTAIRGSMGTGLSVKTQQYMDALDILMETGDVELAQETAMEGGVTLKVTAENAQEQLDATNWH